MMTYFGIERDFTGKGEVWTKVGIIGIEDLTYMEVRRSLDMLDGFRVVTIENREDWTKTFEDGRIIHLSQLEVAIKILGTKVE